jgi:hypothetical protein
MVLKLSFLIITVQHLILKNKTLIVKQFKNTIMKKNSNNLFTPISTEQLENLTSVVNETSAPAFNPSKSKTFNVVDLWNIQRQGKSRIQRRYSF